MAVPFCPEEEAEDDRRRLQEVLALLEQVAAVLRSMLQHLERQPAAPAPAQRSRLPSCEDQQDDDDEDPDEGRPPGVASPVASPPTEPAEPTDADAPLPDVVPQAAPRRAKWPASAFTKYLAAEAAAAAPAEDEWRQPVAESDTTLCFALPDLLAGHESHAPGNASAAPSCRWAGPSAPSAPSGPTGPEPHHPPKPAPRRSPRLPRESRPAWRRPLKPEHPVRPKGVALGGWLQEDELEKTLDKMAAVEGLRGRPMAGLPHSLPALPARDDWVRVGQNLRCLADGFILTTPDEVDGAACAAGKEPGLLSMFLLPPVKGTFLTTMILWVGWSLISRTR